MKKQILSTVAAMTVLVAANAAQAGWYNGMSVNGIETGNALGSNGLETANALTQNGLNTSNALTQNGLNTSNALTQNGLSSHNGVNTDMPAFGARVIFIELPAAR